MSISRTLFCAVLTLAAAPAFGKTLQVGYQRYGTLIILKERGTLEQRLKALGYDVAWTLFPSGPPLLEAMNAGAVQFGITGETPPIFAQAAGAPIVYVGAEPPAPAGEAILVGRTSGITSVAALKGRRVALTRGSNAHYLLLAALTKAGLTWSDITPVYLSPADAPAAFQAGSIDAWSIWDPYLSSALANLDARVLQDGTATVANRQYFLATRSLATAEPAVLKAVLDSVTEADAWATSHKPEVSTLLAGSTGLPLPVVQASVGRLGFGVGPITPEIVAGQQVVADALAKASLIPAPVHVQDDVLAAGR